MVRVNTIAAPLPVYCQFELFIAQLLEQKGYQIIYHNIQVAGVQIDLLAREPSENVLTIVEVKSSNHMSSISARQLRRLFRVGEVIAQFEPVELLLVTMNEGHLLVIPIDGLTV